MYNFIDVNEASESNVLPSEALKINGEYIENQISGYRTLNVQGREALTPDVVTYTTGVRDGSRLKSKRFPERIITVTYQIVAESNQAFREAYNRLGRILNVEDAELIFNDEQDKFFIGTPCTIEPVNPGTNAVVGVFEILCADPFKYSVVEYEAVPTLDDASVLIDYNGTYKAFPTLEADFFDESDTSADGESAATLTGSGDCGYVAFFTEDKSIIQLGDPDEVNEENAYEKSQTLVNSTFKTSSAWGSAAKKQWAVNSGLTSSDYYAQTGSIGMGVASYAVSSNTGSTSGTLLTATSTRDAPHVKYTVTAKATNRTKDSVKVTVSITAAMTRNDYYWYNAGVLVTSVYIGGAWRNVTMKAASDRWNGASGHTKNITVTVTGLSESTTALTGIKFKAYRNDSLGYSGILGETACTNLTIPKYVADVPETYYLTASNFGSGSNGHGPSITRTIPADASGEVGAKNFTLSYSQKMSIGSGNSATSEYGAFQVLLISGSGTSREIVCGVNVYKESSGTKAKLRFYLNHKVMETIDIDLSYGNQYFKSSKTSTIKKTGQTVSFNICGVQRTYHDSAIANVAVNQITFTFSQIGTKAKLAYNGLYWAKFVKNNCDTLKDIPNKFSANDVVVADCKNGEITLNGASAPELGALGNDWEGFYLTPGLNQIGVAYSDWVSKGYEPKFKIRYREVFL